MGIFKKSSKIASTNESTNKSNDDVYNAACLNAAIATGNFKNMSQAEIVECIRSCDPKHNSDT